MLHRICSLLPQDRDEWLACIICYGLAILFALAVIF